MKSQDNAIYKHGVRLRGSIGGMMSDETNTCERVVMKISKKKLQKKKMLRFDEN